MGIFSDSGSSDPQNFNKRVFNLLATVVVIFGVLLVANILFPTFVGLLLNILWVLFLLVVITFFTLGILVIVGMRKEVSHVLDILLEGSLTLIDFIEFVKNLWKRFIQLLKEFLIFSAPIFAYVINLIIYVLLMILYKTVGKSGQDVTALTLALTIVLLLLIGVLNRPAKVIVTNPTWKQNFGARFKAGFIDGFEVLLFIFFITMDRTNLFFLPQELNVLLHAKLGPYDLMVQSINYQDHFKFTLNLLEIAVITEIIRNIIRIVVAAKMYYSLQLQQFIEGQKIPRITAIKNALRMSFQATKPDILKFITYNTVLFSVFLLFPRLKLLTLAAASVTNLLLDVIFRERLTHKGGTDLISRVLGAVFKI